MLMCVSYCVSVNVVTCSSFGFYQVPQHSGLKSIVPLDECIHRPGCSCYEATQSLLGVSALFANDPIPFNGSLVRVEGTARTRRSQGAEK